MNPIPDSHYIGHWWCYHPILVINILVDACMSVTHREMNSYMSTHTFAKR